MKAVSWIENINETKKKQEATNKEEENIQFKNRQQASHRLYNRQI